MLNTILSQITPDVLTAVGVGATVVIVAIIKALGDIAIKYIEKKKDYVEKQIDTSKHTQELQTAKEVWNIIDEKFRITDNIKDLAKSKADEFDKLLLTKLPYLTQSEIADIRQALAGEINKGKEELNKDSLREQQAKIIQENNELTAKNLELQNKIEQLQNVIK